MPDRSSLPTRANNLDRSSFAMDAVGYHSMDNRLDITINTSVQIIWPYDSAVTESAYDPHTFGNTKNPTTYWGTVFHLYMISAGPALLNMPRNYFGVGYTLGFAIILLIFFFYWYSMRMLVRTEYQLCQLRRQPNMTYSETLFYAFDGGSTCWRAMAPYSRHIIHVLYMITWIGAFNLVLIAENLKVVYQTAYHTDIDVHVIMIYIFVPMLLLTWIHRLKYLIPLSIIGNVISVLCILTVVYHIVIDSEPLTVQKDVGSMANIPVFLGSVLFNLNATGLMMPLKNEMSQPKRFNSTFGVLTTTYFPMAFLFAFFGLFCCLKYGDQLQVTVIQNLKVDQYLLQILIIMYTTSLAFQYPLITYVVFDTLWNNILKERQTMLSWVVFWEYTARTAVYAVSYGAAYVVPNLNLFLSISGTVGTAVDSLIFPALVDTLVMRRLHGNEAKFKLCVVKNGFILVLAVLLLVTGLTESVAQIIEYYSDHSHSQ